MDWLAKLKHPIKEIRKRHLRALCDKLSWNVVNVKDLAQNQAFLHVLESILVGAAHEDDETLEAAAELLHHFVRPMYVELAK